ncbi:MAG: hypothetical protein WBV82_17710 [Myxococcaceae bacterium]
MIKRTGLTETPKPKTDLDSRERLLNVLKPAVTQKLSRPTGDGFESKATATSQKLARVTGGGETTGTGALPPAVREKLSPAELAQANKVLSGSVSPHAKQDLEELVGSVGFRTLDADVQVRLVQSVLSEPKSSLQNARLTELVASPGFRALPPAQQQKAIKTFEVCDPKGQGKLLDLAKRNVEGQPALLDKDAEGVALLDRLHSLATDPLNENFERHGIDREELLASILQECSKPGQINQDGHNTCTATSMQYLLCDQNPAEYVRLMEGLLSGDGKVEMRGGQTLKLEQDSIAPDSSTRRSASERVFQSAMMEYANGGESYSTTDDQSRGKKLWLFDYSHEGLNADAQERGLEALFGRDYKQHNGEVIGLVTERSPEDTYVRMSWGEGKEGGHAVVATRVEDGRVYFRNPWGPTGDKAGTTYEDPPRRLENPSIREESMTVEEFEAWCKGAIV